MFPNTPSPQPQPLFDRLDADRLLRGRQALRALVQRERADWITVGKSERDNLHIVTLVDGGRRMVGFDSLPDDSWQISDQDTSDLILCATGEQHSHDVQRVLYASGDRVRSLMYRTRAGGEFEVVAVTRGGHVTVHAWDPVSVAWRFVSTVKIPLTMGEEGMVSSAVMAMDEQHIYWLERASRADSGAQRHTGSDDDSCSDSEEEDDSSGSSDGSSSSSGAEGAAAMGVKRFGKHRMHTLCCSRMNAGRRQDMGKVGSVEHLFDINDILQTGPTSRFEGEVALVSEIALQKRAVARLMPASPVGCWGLFSRESAPSISRLAYFSHDMTASDGSPWDILPTRAHRQTEAANEPAWCVSAGVAQTLTTNTGDFVVLMSDGTLVKHIASCKPGENPTSHEMCKVSLHFAEQAVDMGVVGSFYGIVTRDSSVLLVDAESGVVSPRPLSLFLSLSPLSMPSCKLWSSDAVCLILAQVRREVQLPILGEKDRMYKGRYVVKGPPQWRAVGHLSAPSLVEIPGGGGAWRYSSKTISVYWQKGLALWALNDSAFQDLAVTPLGSPVAMRLANVPPEERKPGGEMSTPSHGGTWPTNSAGVDQDEDTHLVELMMSAWDKGDVTRASALADEVHQSPSLMMMMMISTRRRGPYSPSYSPSIQLLQISSQPYFIHFHFIHISICLLGRLYCRLLQDGYLPPPSPFLLKTTSCSPVHPLADLPN